MSLHAPISPRLPASPRRRAFTLIEVLVVMGIIILLVVLALPAFRFITGSRSSEAATNQIAAALSVARAQAIGVQDTRGVAIYRDPDNDRSVAAIVELKTTFTPFVSGTGQTYTRGQYVYTGGTPAVAYVCKETYVSNNNTLDPVPAGNQYWARVADMDVFVNTGVSVVDLVPNSEFITLPVGIEARGVANAFRWPNNVNSAANPAYRYLNPPVVLFDYNGQILSQQIYIARNGLLGQKIEQATSGQQPGSWLPVPLSPPSVATKFAYGVPTAGVGAYQTTTSQIGLVVFDSETYKNATSTGTVDEANQWLDQNATPIMVNRFNGTLVKGD
jgi:type II secretory pathway pseudopilin PulG